MAMAMIFLSLIAIIFGIRELFRSPSSPVERVDSRGAVGIIYIEGEIVGGSSQRTFFPGLLGTDYILEQLRQAQEDPIKALVLRINSPGGSAAAAQEIYREVQRVRESGKVVVASLADVAASGGYLIANAADRIIANPGTITGSIGVIMDVTNFKEFYEMLGIDYEAIKSGEFKDMGHPGRELTDRERELLQLMVDDIYEQFVDTVIEGRQMPEEKVRELADGRVFTGRQALELGLVDGLGNIYDAINVAADLAEIEGEPVIYRYRSSDPWRAIIPWLSRGGIEFFSQPQRELITR